MFQREDVFGYCMKFTHVINVSVRKDAQIDGFPAMIRTLTVSNCIRKMFSF